jgi:hypothetical protein
MILRASPAPGTAADLRAFQPQTTTTQPPASRPSLLYGNVVSVDVATGKVVIAPKEGPQVTVATGANTKVQVLGKDATLADIKAGMVLRVSPAMGAAADSSGLPAEVGRTAGTCPHMSSFVISCLPRRLKGDNFRS